MTATAPQDTMLTGSLQRIALAELHEHPENPRHTFDLVALEQLKDQLVGSVGQLTPILVRPNPNTKQGGYQLLAGHRRERAARLGQLTHLVAAVRVVDDRTAYEILTIENLQRDNLHPLEEAEGFELLMKKAGYDIQQLAHRVGKSESYVYDSVRLLQLTPDLKQRFLKGQFQKGHAILLARLSKSDQTRAMGTARSQWTDGGLFQVDHRLEVPGLELDDKREEQTKPHSVAELQGWIDQHVRFDPSADDTPVLFPETAEQVKAALAAKGNVVPITHSHYIQPETRAKKGNERVYFPQSWHRADGKSRSRVCPHSVMGVIMMGPGRGDAFKVCVEKKKCAIHWPQEARNAARKAKGEKPAKGKSAAAVRDDWQARHDREERERQRQAARWDKAIPEILKQLAAKLATAKTVADSPLGNLIIAECKGHRRIDLKALISPGKTADDLVRFAGMLALAGVVCDNWRRTDAARALKPFGLDPAAIVLAVNGPEKPEEPKTLDAEAPAAKVKGATQARFKKPTSRKK